MAVSPQELMAANPEHEAETLALEVRLDEQLRRWAAENPLYRHSEIYLPCPECSGHVLAAVVEHYIQAGWRVERRHLRSGIYLQFSPAAR